jgi:hypothetical protein
LRQILAAGVDHGLVPVNVVDRVKAPKVTPKSARALDADDARRLIIAAREHRLGAAVALLFVQGWRVSEVLGLAWSDLDVGPVLRRSDAPLLTSTAGHGAWSDEDGRCGRCAPSRPRRARAMLSERRKAQRVERLAAVNVTGRGMDAGRTFCRWRR